MNTNCRNRVQKVKKEQKGQTRSKRKKIILRKFASNHIRSSPSTDDNLEFHTTTQATDRNSGLYAIDMNENPNM